MNIQMIALNTLVHSPANVRRIGTKIGIDELAASIAAHGLLQNLQVRPNTDGKYEVVAGGRRLAALKLLAKRREIAKDVEIGCNVLAAEDDTEISLAENQHEPMHPADQFDAFRQMVDAGRSVEDVATRFGVTVLLVNQRLKLARVSPRLIALYREGGMTLEQLMAFTVADDHTAQEPAWFDAPDYNRSAHSIRRRLTESHVSASDGRVQFVGLDEYRRAGGAIITDLFQAEHEGYLTDPALLDRLCAERLGREAAIIREEGWKWVEIMPDHSFGALRSYGRQYGKPLPMPAKQAKALAKVEATRDALAEKDELTDEEDEKLAELDEQIGTLREVPVEWSERKKKRCGAVLRINYEGQLEAIRGLIAPADIKASCRDAGDNGNAEQEGEGDTQPKDGLSNALRDDLTAQRTAALRAALAANTSVTLVALAHALTLPLFYPGSDHPFDIHAVSAPLRGEAIEDYRGGKDMAGRYAAWQQRLPEEPETLWAWLTALDHVGLLELLAYTVAATLKPERRSDTDHVAASIGFDLTPWWKPTAAGYFSRVSKEQIASAITEGVSAEAAASIAKLKKGEMAERAEALLAATLWLPPFMR